MIKILSQIKYFRSLFFNRTATESIKKFRFPEGNDISLDIRDKYDYSGPFLDSYVNNTDNTAHKWHHYIPIYEKYLHRYRDHEVRILEIGVSQGGGLSVLRKYLGERAIIYGIDIDPGCEKYNGTAGEVRIGSQSDRNFLLSVVEEMGGIDVVIDDGSHQMLDIQISLKTLFSRLNDNGVYLIEDLHTSYWSGWGGGLKSKDNFFCFLKKIFDGMHHWYHADNSEVPEVTSFLSAVHIYDSMVVFEKNRTHRPTHSKVPQPPHNIGDI